MVQYDDIGNIITIDVSPTFEKVCKILVISIRPNIPKDNKDQDGK